MRALVVVFLLPWGRLAAQEVVLPSRVLAVPVAPAAAPAATPAATLSGLIAVPLTLTAAPPAAVLLPAIPAALPPAGPEDAARSGNVEARAAFVGRPGAVEAPERNSPAEDAEPARADSGALFDARAERPSPGEVEPIPEGLLIRGRLRSAGWARTNVYDASLPRGRAVVKVTASPEEASIQRAMSLLTPPAANVRVPAVFGAEPATPELGRRIDPDGRLEAYAWNEYALKDSRHVLVQEPVPAGFFSLKKAVPPLPEMAPQRSLRPIRPEDWAGLVASVAFYHAHGLGFGDLRNLSNIRVRQRGGLTEFALIDMGGGTRVGDPKTLAEDRAALADLRRALIERGLLSSDAAPAP